jgi:hypothetical protein
MRKGILGDFIMWSVNWSAKDRGCDNVLLGQGYQTLQRVVIDEYGAMVE